MSSQIIQTSGELLAAAAAVSSVLLAGHLENVGPLAFGGDPDEPADEEEDLDDEIDDEDDDEDEDEIDDEEDDEDEDEIDEEEDEEK